MPRIAKLACTISALAVLVSCGGSANTPPPIRVLSIATTSLSDGFVTFAYVQTIQADGGVAPFSWAVSSGSLPHNLTLGSSSTNSVTISGTPDTVQTAVTFAIQVTDAKRQTATKLFSVNVNNVVAAQLQEVRGSSAVAAERSVDEVIGIVLRDHVHASELRWARGVR